jgi:hypothetical protein
MRGAFDDGAGEWLSGTPKDIISTMLDTSFLIFSGSTSGISFCVNSKLQRYMASANSGKNNWPDFVVSDKTLEDVSQFSPTHCEKNKRTIFLTIRSQVTWTASTNL